MGILSGYPKAEPAHYGEIYDAFMTLAGGQAMISRYQLFYNHCGDEDLREFIHHIIENRLRPHVEELKNFLKENGAPLPPAPAERGEADRERIPPAARFTDPEIATMVAADHAIGSSADTAAMVKCLREDIAAMYAKFNAEKIADGARLLRLMKDKGWIIPPPLHVKPREEVLT
ncbi:DUF3231 family protein [Staphylospora marina]|uniref:DUF3231 family protein n=1 Tax=Staphylospora marina TaxID=2490858 RepID=UPI000F5C0C88|nr:DUF3231 family protein [Staphylospora marina]